VTSVAPAAPAPAPVEAPAARYEPAPLAQAEEPDLFEAAAEPAFRPEPEEALDSDLPPPVYRPQVAAAPAQPRPTPAVIDADAAGFVAPRPRAPGQPSAEAMARLTAAVSKNPAITAQRAAAVQRSANPAPQPAPAPAPAAAKPRFGIGSLINRMAGHLEAATDRAPQAAPGRAQPPVTSYDDETDHATDDNRIEIPAFLRRQAN
jgi:cell division protein FtsZ